MRATIPLLMWAAVSVVNADRAVAQSYPTKPLHMIIAAEAGGGPDVLARSFTPSLSEQLGQPIIVEDKPGGNGALGFNYVVRGAADGYTLMMAGNNFLIFPLLDKTVTYDPIRDFAPVVQIATSPNVLVVNPNVAVTSVKDLVALAKANPGVLNYATGSSGASPHMAGELFQYLAKVSLTRVPYKGAAPAITDLLGGRDQVMFAIINDIRPAMKAGKVRALAVTTQKRSALEPDLPTIAEAGVPGYDSGVSYGMLVKAGTADGVIRRLNQEMVRYLQRPEIKKQMLDAGLEVAASTPEEYGNSMKAEMNRWSDLIKSANIKLDQ